MVLRFLSYQSGPHIVYVKETADLVPTWLPYRVGRAYVTGAGQIACGLALLFTIFPRVSAIIEALMISLFTLLVWGPAILVPLQRHGCPGQHSSSHAVRHAALPDDDSRVASRSGVAIRELCWGGDPWTGMIKSVRGYGDSCSNI